MPNDVTIHVKSEDHTDMNVIGRKVEAKAKTSFARVGAHSGAAFSAGFIKTITLGLVGGGWAQSAAKLAPGAAGVGAALGVAVAGALVLKLSTYLAAALPLALGAGLVAGPIAFLVKGQTKMLDSLDKAYAKSESLRTQIANTNSKKRKAVLQEELKGQEQEIAFLKKRTEGLRALQGEAKTFMQKISAPLQKPLNQIFKDIGKTMKDLEGPLTKAMGKLGKPLEKLVHGALKGVANFIKEIADHADEIGASFKAWGEEFPDLGKKLGKALTAFLRDPKKTTEAVKQMATDLGTLAGALGTVAGWLNSINGGFDDLANKDRGRHVLEGYNQELSKFKLPKINWNGLTNSRFYGAFKTISNAFKRFAAGAKIRTMQVEAAFWDMAVGALKAAAKMFSWVPGMKGKFDRAIAYARNARDRINAALAGIRKRVDVNIRVHAGFDASVARARTLANRGLVARASGGNVGSAATGGARGNRVLVGEQGPEIVDLPMGSHVNSNADSRRIASQGRGGGGITINVMAPNYVGAPADLLRALVDAKRRGQLDVILR